LEKRNSGETVVGSGVAGVEAAGWLSVRNEGDRRSA
jgi:NADH dehydrogenase FAD-containing subunit